MSYPLPVHTLRLHSSHPSTRHPGPKPAPTPSSYIHLHSTRRTHLPPLPPSASHAATTRALHGYPPLYTTADADQLSDLEESLDLLRDTTVRFGESHIVQLGRRRTLAEEELSDDEDARRHSLVPSVVDPGAAGASRLHSAGSNEVGDEDDGMQARGPNELGRTPAMVEEDEAAERAGGEGMPGAFYGGHTGHVQAQLDRQQMLRAEQRIREAEAQATRAAAAANAARSTAQRHAAFQSEQDAVDLDADVEDLDDDDGDDVDFD